MSSAYQTMPPFLLSRLTIAERDELEPFVSMQIWNVESGFHETYGYDRWSPYVTLSTYPLYNDTVIFDTLSGTFRPTPAGTPTFSSVKIYDDATNVLEVKRLYR